MAPPINNTLRLTDQMTPVLKSILTALNSTLTAMASVDKVSNKAFDQARRATERANRALEQYRATIRTVQNQSPVTEQTINRQNRFTDSVNRSSNAMSGLVGWLQTMLVTYGLIQGTRAIIQGGDAFIGNTARLNLMNDGLRTTAELQDRIYEAAQRSVTSYREMQHSVAKLGLLASSAFQGNNDQMIAFAELMNKQFAISGATPWEKSAGMYQLTQAMASGRLQGDEFRSIIENAPMLAETIRRYMGLDGKQMKDASRKGLITADIIKNALFSTADKVNKMYADMPMRFSDLWVQSLNKIDKAMEKTLYPALSEMWNSKKFQEFLDLMVNGFIHFLNLLMKVGQVVGNIITWISKNWDVMGPIVWFLGSIIGLVVLLNALIIPLITSILGIGAAFWFLTTPVGIFLLVLGGIIAFLYLIVAIVNRVMETSLNATGVIVGAVLTALAFLGNIVVGFVSIILSIVDAVVNIIVVACEGIYNAFVYAFTGWTHIAQAAFWSLIDGMIETIKPLLKVFDKINGTNYANFASSKAQQHMTDFSNARKGMEYKEFGFKSSMGQWVADKYIMDLNEVGQFGYNWGKIKHEQLADVFKLGDKTYHVEDLFNNPEFEAMRKAFGIGNDALNGIKNNTGKTADLLLAGVALSDEDVEALKDYARIQFVNRFTTMTPNITATFGDVKETADVNGILELIKQSFINAYESSLRT